MKIKSLTLAELHRYEAHLLRLSPQDRHLRFSGFVSDDSIRQYVKSIKPINEVVKVIYDDDLNIVGAVHVILMTQSKYAEIALSVEPQARGRGIGKKLFTSAVKWVRTRAVTRVYSVCLRDNRPMVRIAANQGMTLFHDSQETEAYLEVDKPTMFAYLDELMDEQSGWADYAQKKFKHLYARAS